MQSDVNQQNKGNPLWSGELRALESLMMSADPEAAEAMRLQLNQVRAVDRGMVFGRYEAHMVGASGPPLPQKGDSDIALVAQGTITGASGPVDVWLYANRGRLVSLEASEDLRLV